MGTDPQTLAKLQQLLNDPVMGPKLLAMINQPGQQQPMTSSGVAGDLSNVGSMMSKQQTPSGQIGSGIGGAIGMGVQALRRGAMKKKPTTSSAPGSYLSQAGVTPASGPGSYLDQIGVSAPPETPAAGGDAGLVGGNDDYDGGNDDFIGGEDDEYAKGGKVKRGVLVRRPVLSTTIVIAKKPEKKKEKPDKKRKGGAIQARKPAAIPPKRGPGPPAPTPKGAMCKLPAASAARSAASNSAVFTNGGLLWRKSPPPLPPSNRRVMFIPIATKSRCGRTFSPPRAALQAM